MSWYWHIALVQYCYQSKSRSKKLLPTLKSLLLLQLCGVRGGGEAASQAMFWQPSNDLSLVLAFETARERNTAIMLARRFAIDCNVCAVAEHYAICSWSYTAATVFLTLVEMVADHPCWARRQNSLVKGTCSAPPIQRFLSARDLRSDVHLRAQRVCTSSSSFLVQSGLFCSSSCCRFLKEGAVRTVLTASAPSFCLTVLCFFFFSCERCDLLLAAAAVIYA